MTDSGKSFPYFKHLNELDVFLNTITEPVLVYDANGIAVKINDAGIASLGFNPTGLSSSEIAQKISPHTSGKKTEIEDSISNRVLKGEIIKDFSSIFRTPRGEEKICSYSASPVKIDGRIAGIICTWHDFTRDKKKESFFNNERNRLLKILDSIQDGIYICNENYSVEYANPEIIKRLGNPRGKKCYEYLYKRKEQCPWCKIPEVFSGKTIKWEWYDPESRKTYDLTETPIYNADGSVSKLKIFHDITDIKEREKSLNKDKKLLLHKVDEINTELIKKTTDLEDKKRLLQQQSEIIEKLFANTHFLIALLNTDFTFIRVNKAYAAADGRDEEFFIGKNHFDLYPHDENKAIFNKVLETGESYITYAKPFSYPEKPEIGITYWDWSLNPVKDDKEKVTGLLLILLDVTARKKTGMALAEAKRLSDIGALATTVAHELRSPLGVIQGTVYNVKKKNMDEKLLKNMERIERKIGESEKIINNLLNYSIIKQPDIKKISIHRFLDECIHDIKKQYMNSEIEVNRNYASLKNTSIEIDPFQLREVFLNILNNAFQAFPANKGNIDIKGNIKSASLLIDIRDNGQGIDREDLKNIFEPFFTRKSKGTGLGLTICRELVHLHNGTITVESEKGKGTVVHISLPVRSLQTKRDEQ
ncbi:MAG: PAS domain-containing protein [Spirochaetales bacterium]|nr:PAS domain-containing protein [Spirochaetales bacterium]